MSNNIRSNRLQQKDLHAYESCRNKESVSMCYFKERDASSVPRYRKLTDNIYRNTIRDVRINTVISTVPKANTPHSTIERVVINTSRNG